MSATTAAIPADPSCHLLIEGAARSPRLPQQITKALRMLHPARQAFAETSHAAMALFTFYTRAGKGPGIQLPGRDYQAKTHLRGDTNLPSFEVLAPGQPHSHRALLFHDQSVVVLRISHLPGQPAQALPIVFRLKSVAQDGLPILHVSNPDRSNIAAQIGFKDRPRDPTPLRYSAIEIEARDSLYRHPCLEALRGDLRRLASLFDSLPWIVAPQFGPLPTGPIDAKTALALNLPREAIGAELAWPEALPFQLIERADRVAIQSYLADFASWVLCSFEGVESASASLTLPRPGKPKHEWGTIWVTTRAASGPKGRLTGADWTPGYLMAEPDRFCLPVPAARLSGLNWDTSGTQMKQRAQDIRLPAAFGERPSNHERLRLAGLFGEPRPGGLA